MTVLRGTSIAIIITSYADEIIACRRHTEETSPEFGHVDPKDEFLSSTIRGLLASQSQQDTIL